MTWTPTAKENYEHPMWPGPRFGAPFFFHYGKNGGNVTRDQADEYVYAISTNGFWNDGDNYILGRVPRGKLPALRAADWSYFVGGNGLEDKSWSPQIEAAKPVLEMKSKCGQTAPCYIPALKTYLLVAWYNPVLLKKWYSPSEMVCEFYQEPHPWGPWTHVNSLSDRFLAPGSNMYGPAICSKFQESEGGDVRVWMFTSGCQFEDKPGGLYKAWAIPLVLRMQAIPDAKMIDDGDPAVRYTGGWEPVTARKENDFHSGIRRAAEAGAAAELAFEGTGIDLLAPKAAAMGALDVWIDGTHRNKLSLGTINFPAMSQITVFSARGLASGRHTIRVVSAGPDPVAIDAFRILGGNTAPADE